MKLLRSIALAAFCLFFFSGQAKAQLFTAGAGYSAVLENMQNSGVPTQSFANAITAGVEWHFGFYKHFGCTVGAHYMYAFSGGPDDVNKAVRESYRESAVLIPAYANYTFLQVNYDYQFFVFAGPTLEVGITSSLKSDGNTAINLYSSSNPGQNRVNLWLGAGIGLDIYRSVLLKVGYQRSMLNYARSAPGITIFRDLFTVGIQVTFASNGAWAESY